MKQYLVLLPVFVVGFYCCSSPTPTELFGIWKIDQFLVDGMDRTRKASFRYEPLDWGTGIKLSADGSFSTNRDGQGQWKLSSNGELWLFPVATKDTLIWDVIVSKNLLVLASRTKRVTLSRTNKLPKLIEKIPNLITNLPGTWYFYRWYNRTDTLRYPSAKKQAHWLTFEKDGEYHSGEGKHQSFQGKWLLEDNTLHLSELERSLKQSWQLHLISDTLYVEPATDTTEWFKALLVRKM